MTFLIAAVTFSSEFSSTSSPLWADANFYILEC